ncbi:MAG: hypothetical protein K8S20_01525 [Chloroflexi bacterium]|nr:hypothetical protein [Chloroflexota bacterium]
MPRRILIFTVLVALLVYGCSSSGAESVKSSLPALEGGWTIQMNHSGGIMGLSRSIDISSTGKYLILDERAGKSVTGQLAGDELSQLMEIVATSEYRTKDSQLPSACADCFIYDLEIAGSRGNFKVQLDDVSLPDSGMEPLVTLLRNWMDAALK